MKILDLNYKKTKFEKGFAVLPDFTLKLFNELGLKPVDRLLYICLYHHADTVTGLCYPSYKILKQYTGIQNNKSIKSGLDRLCDVGLIEIVQKGFYDHEAGIQKCNTYKIRFPYPSDFVFEKVSV